MKSRVTWRELGITGYKDYFNTAHWKRLRKKYIKPSTKCYVCGTNKYLALHHASYQNLGHEKINKDLYVLCFRCHTKVHYYLFKLIRVPLSKDALLASMYYRKAIYKLGNLNIIAFIWYLIRSVIYLVF